MKADAAVRQIMVKVSAMAEEDRARSAEMMKAPPDAAVRVDAAGIGWDKASVRFLPLPPKATLDWGQSLAGAWAPVRSEGSFSYYYPNSGNLEPHDWGNPPPGGIPIFCGASGSGDDGDPVRLHASFSPISHAETLTAEGLPGPYVPHFLRWPHAPEVQMNQPGVSHYCWKQSQAFLRTPVSPIRRPQGREPLPTVWNRLGWVDREEARVYGGWDDTRARWLGMIPRLEGEVIAETLRLVNTIGCWAAEQFLLY